ncbi:MAG: cytochrome c [Thermodesulfobacteriota bacterium]|nr:cytochrome c [Thermodesulfobacteriota bacterium]
MQRITSSIIIFLFACLCFSVPFSYCDEGEALFQSRCGKCHRSGGEGPIFSPVKYASSQWKRFFEKDKHARKRDISGDVSPADLEAIKQYLMDHAADSDLPVSTGLR